MGLKITGKIKRTPRLVFMGVILIGLVLVTAACSAQGAQKVKATWIKPQSAGETVSISANDIKNNKIVHFNAVAAGKQEAFMAYELDGKINVRANVCPLCRSIGFSLNNDTLVCDTCQTTFKASSGAGINGACVAFPKAAVAYQINGSDVVMRVSDLAQAYQSTLEPGWP